MKDKILQNAIKGERQCIDNYLKKHGFDDRNCRVIWHEINDLVELERRAK